MLIRAKVHPGARRDILKREGGGFRFEIWVKEKPVQGKANLAVKKMLAEYFGVSANEFKLIKGRSSRNKIFELAQAGKIQ